MTEAPKEADLAGSDDTKAREDAFSDWLMNSDSSASASDDTLHAAFWGGWGAAYAERGRPVYVVAIGHDLGDGDAERILNAVSNALRPEAQRAAAGHELCAGLLETARDLIANTGWGRATPPGWREAAERWRDRHLAALPFFEQS